MALNKGNAACSAGLSKRIFDQLVADPSAGFSSPLSASQETAVKAICWAVAQSVVDEIVANAQVIDSGGTATGEKVK